jgi:hypothetical protein
MNFHLHQAYQPADSNVSPRMFTNEEEADIVFHWIDSIISSYNGIFINVEVNYEHARHGPANRKKHS